MYNYSIHDNDTHSTANCAMTAIDWRGTWQAAQKFQTLVP